MTILKSSTYRYIYTFGGQDVGKIYFYDDTGILYETRSGYLQPLHNPKDVYSTHDNDRFELEISGYPNQRNKLNLTRKEHFYMKDTSGYETKINFYLYVGEGSEFKLDLVDEVVTKQSFQHYEATTFHWDIFKLSGKNLVEPIYLAQIKSRTTRQTKLGKQADELVDYLNKNGFYDLDKWEMSNLLALCNVTVK